MKLSYAFTFCFLILGFAQTGHTNDFVPFSLTKDSLCIIEKDSVICAFHFNNIGSFIKLNFERKLKNPRLIASNSIMTCVHDDLGITCIKGTEYYSPTDYHNPSISQSIRHLVVNDNSMCAFFTSSTPQCWGAWGNWAAPQASSIPLNKIKSVARNWNELCAFTDEGVFCNRVVSMGLSNLEKKYANPRIKAISAGDTNICFIDDKGATCWGTGNWSSTLEKPARLILPKAISVGESHACAIDSEGVKCWGDNSRDQLKVPVIKDPLHIVAYGASTCASTDTEVICWGSIGDHRFNLEKAIISANFFNAPHESLDRISYISSPAKNRFFNELSNFSKAHLLITSKTTDVKKNEIHFSSYLLLSLIKPAIFSGDSELYAKDVIPGFDYTVTAKNKELSLNSIQEIPYSSELLNLTALKVIQASVLIAKDFLSLNDQKALGPLTKSLGLAMANPSQEHIRAVLQEISKQTPLLEKLNNSTKTSFLFETTKTTSLYLDKKVQ